MLHHRHHMLHPLFKGSMRMTLDDVTWEGAVSFLVGAVVFTIGLVFLTLNLFNPIASLIVVFAAPPLVGLLLFIAMRQLISGRNSNSQEGQPAIISKHVSECSVAAAEGANLGASSARPSVDSSPQVEVDPQQALSGPECSLSSLSVR